MSRSDWIDRVHPPVPQGFAPWLRLPTSRNVASVSDSRAPDGAERSLPEAEELLAAALEALGRALKPEGRERGGAFDLLAADAFATWAAEALLDAPRVEEELERLRDRLAGESGSG